VETSRDIGIHIGASVVNSDSQSNLPTRQVINKLRLLLLDHLCRLVVCSSFDEDFRWPTTQLTLNPINFCAHNFMQSGLKCADLLLHVLRVKDTNLLFAWLLKIVSHHNRLNVKIRVNPCALSREHLCPLLGLLIKYIDVNDRVALGNVPQCDEQLNLL